MSKSLVGKALDNPIQFALGAGIILGVLYFVGKKIIGDVAGVARGTLSGNNALTTGTPYAGGGVVGTIAAATNEASGGVLQSIGDSVGGWFYGLTHQEYDPNEGYTSGARVVKEGADNIDALWGSIGSVQLRRK